MPKLAVFDLDGTLLNDEHEITTTNIASLRRLKEIGCRIMIATGRTDLLVKEYIKKLEIDAPVISCNGATIRNPFTMEEIFKNVLEPQIVKDVIDICARDGHTYLVYCKDCMITIPNERAEEIQKRNERLDEDCRAEFKMNISSSQIAFEHEVYKVLIIEKDADKFMGLKDKFKHISGITMCQSNKGYMDIMKAGTSKKNALKMYAEMNDIDIKDIVAFGDNYNDIEMLEFAGRAVTTENGVDEVKKMVDFISRSNNEDGVAFAIKEYLRII